MFTLLPSPGATHTEQQPDTALTFRRELWWHSHSIRWLLKSEYKNSGTQTTTIATQTAWQQQLLHRDWKGRGILYKSPFPVEIIFIFPSHQNHKCLHNTGRIKINAVWWKLWHKQCLCVNEVAGSLLHSLEPHFILDGSWPEAQLAPVELHSEPVHNPPENTLCEKEWALDGLDRRCFWQNSSWDLLPCLFPGDGPWFERPFPDAAPSQGLLSTSPHEPWHSLPTKPLLKKPNYFQKNPKLLPFSAIKMAS